MPNSRPVQHKEVSRTCIDEIWMLRGEADTLLHESKTVLGVRVAVDKRTEDGRCTACEMAMSGRVNRQK